MEFTYEGYSGLLKKINQYGYTVASYDNCDLAKKCVILRHDIDYDITKTVRIGKIEKEMGVKSTFFLLISSDFYNVFSTSGACIIDRIQDYGHDIGLHFDEQRYQDDFGCTDRIREHILEEARVLEKAVGNPVTKVSMHRPSKEIIESNLTIPGMINTYSSKFVNDFKYVSDSRRRWREPVEEYIINETYNKIQILTHPFWYNETELELRDSILGFIESSKRYRYDILNNNFSNLEEIMNKDDI